MKTVIHIATSVDGFIADAAGGTHWLEEISNEIGVFERIIPFIRDVDGVVMGRKTYEQALTFPEWAYPGKTCLVVTSSSAAPQTPKTEFIRPDDILPKAAEHGIELLWVVGGGVLCGYMVEQGWVDELIVTVSPIVLGKGQPLMSSLGKHVLLKFKESHNLPAGFVELTYTFA